MFHNTISLKRVHLKRSKCCCQESCPLTMTKKPRKTTNRLNTLQITLIKTRLVYANSGRKDTVHLVSIMVDWWHVKVCWGRSQAAQKTQSSMPQTHQKGINWRDTRATTMKQRRSCASWRRRRMTQVKAQCQLRTWKNWPLNLNHHKLLVAIRLRRVIYRIRAASRRVWWTAQVQGLSFLHKVIWRLKRIS